MFKFSEMTGVGQYTLDCAEEAPVAQMLQIRSDPTLMCIQQGRVVAAAEGGTADSVNGFFIKLAQMFGMEWKVDVADVLIDAVAALASEDYKTAAAMMSTILDSPEAMAAHRADAYAGLSICALKLEGMEKAKDILARGAKEYSERQDAPLPKRARALVEFTEIVGESTDEESHQVAEAMVAGRVEDAVELALSLVKREKTDQSKELAKQVIAALPADSKVAARARRRFANLCFV